MNDYEQRIKVLEDKVKILEETLETLKNMQMSEQMESYIKAKTRTLKMAELINSISDGSELDLSREQNAVREIKAQKKSIDDQVESALRKSDDYSEKCATDIKYFEYEIENGKDSYNSNIYSLSEYVGKGIRITAYNGFDCKSVIIPSEIDGLPVTSIGEKVFMNTDISEILLPKTMIAILQMSFKGCKNLKKIELPENLQYLGSGCFNSSGLITVIIPNKVTEVTCGCFSNCSNMVSVSLGSGISFIDEEAFRGTQINTFIIPANVQHISCRILGGDSSSHTQADFVFMGIETDIQRWYVGSRFANVKTIYCLPGSKAQKYAREYGIPTKPLSEFKMEE